MTSAAPTVPNPMVSVDRRRSMFKAVCGAVLGVTIVATADFALAQLTHVDFLRTAAKEFAQRSALLAQAGDREGAVEASRKAVDAYRRLVHGSPVHYEPGLAASLHDLSLRLREAGDPAGARAAIEEAIVMRRRWARYGARYAEGLAKSLALLTSIEMAAPGSVKTANAMR
jgi:Tetratricopeptide repeat